jgi:hypothetical protein
VRLFKRVFLPIIVFVCGLSTSLLEFFVQLFERGLPLIIKKNKNKIYSELKELKKIGHIYVVEFN